MHMHISHDSGYGRPCAWCGSRDTYFLGVRNWEEDERGNTIVTDGFDQNYTPRDELWRCNVCDDDFVIPYNHEQEAPDHATD